MTLNKNKLVEIKFKYEREMYQVKKSINNYTKELEEYKEYINIIDNADDTRREIILNLIFLLSQDFINQEEFIKSCPEFMKYKDENIKKIMKDILSSYWDINLERKMYCIKLYIILDEGLTLIIKDVLNENVVYGGVMPKLKQIKDIVSINIAPQKELELNILSCIRNDIVHNQSIFSKKSIDDLLKHQNKNEQDIEQLFGLRKDEVIKINMMKILDFEKISREIFNEIYNILKQ